jgi:hypothetical protein
MGAGAKIVTKTSEKIKVTSPSLKDLVADHTDER